MRIWLRWFFAAFGLVIVAIAAWVIIQVNTYPVREQRRIELLCSDVVEKRQYDLSGSLYYILDRPKYRSYTKLIPGTNLLIISESDGKLHIKVIFCNLDGQFLRVEERIMLNDLYFTPDGQELLITHWNGEVNRIELNPFEVLDVYMFCTNSKCSKPEQLSFHPTAPLLSYSIRDYDQNTESSFSYIYLFNIETGENVAQLDLIADFVESLQFLEDGRYLQAVIRNEGQQRTTLQWDTLDYQ